MHGRHLFGCTKGCNDDEMGARATSFCFVKSLWIAGRSPLAFRLVRVSFSFCLSLPFFFSLIMFLGKKDWRPRFPPVFSTEKRRETIEQCFVAWSLSCFPLPCQVPCPTHRLPVRSILGYRSRSFFFQEVDLKWGQFPGRVPVAAVACGNHHTLILSMVGTVHSCG